MCILSCAGIADLVFVKRSLKTLLYWQPLGLQLGLFSSTLDKIQQAGLNMPEDCKTRMLAAWLKQVDNVCNTSHPSWSSLKTALKKIGEDILADSIPTDGELYWLDNNYVSVCMCQDICL